MVVFSVGGGKSEDQGLKTNSYIVLPYESLVAASPTHHHRLLPRDTGHKLMVGWAGESKTCGI